MRSRRVKIACRKQGAKPCHAGTMLLPPGLALCCGEKHRFEKREAGHPCRMIEREPQGDARAKAVTDQMAGRIGQVAQGHLGAMIVIITFQFARRAAPMTHQIRGKQGAAIRQGARHTLPCAGVGQRAMQQHRHRACITRIAPAPEPCDHSLPERNRSRSSIRS